MSRRISLAILSAFSCLLLRVGLVGADDHPDDHHDGSAERRDGEHKDGEHHDAEHKDGEHKDAEHHDAAAEYHEADAEADADEVPYQEFDADGDGQMEPDEVADAKELKDLEKDMPHEVVEGALDKRPDDSELKPSIDAETFRKIVRLTRKFQLGRMENKMAKNAAKRMGWFSMAVTGFSLTGLLLLFMPLVLRNKYPGQGKRMFKYSALAAVTFVVTVNLFGGVLMVMRTTQGVLGPLTNPTLAIAGGTFDTLDTNAEEYITTGKELFVPTLEQMKGNSDEQPAVLLLENGVKVAKDAKVFITVAKMFKKISFIFAVIPIVLLAVTMIFFLLALRPTLTQIVKLPAMAAQGAANAGKDVVRDSMRRVGTEFIATLATIGVLFGITLVSAFVLGRVVGPAIDTLLGYFSEAVNYLQFAEGASSTLVFLALFGVILFLVFNLAALIVSTIFFLSKSQKIFQQRFNEGVPLARHLRFWKWGTASVMLVQLFPWLFVWIADKLLVKINLAIVGTEGNAANVSWTKLMLAGPAFLVVGFLAMFWAARGVKAIKFLIGYKVKPQQVVLSTAAGPVPPR
jgi:hypothetical protein